MLWVKTMPSTCVRLFGGPLRGDVKARLVLQVVVIGLGRGLITSESLVMRLSA
jgi:hypothetical protein